MGQHQAGIGYNYGYGAQFGGVAQGGYGYQQVMGQSQGFGAPHSYDDHSQQASSHHSEDRVDTKRVAEVVTVAAITTTTTTSTKTNTILNNTEDTVDSPMEWATKITTLTNAEDTQVAWVIRMECNKEAEITNPVVSTLEDFRMMTTKKERREGVDSNNKDHPTNSEEVNNPLASKDKDPNLPPRPVLLEVAAAGLTKVVAGVVAVPQAGKEAKRRESPFCVSRRVQRTNALFQFILHHIMTAIVLRPLC